MWHKYVMFPYLKANFSMAFSFFENLNFSKHRITKAEIIFSPLFAKVNVSGHSPSSRHQNRYNLLTIFKTSKN